MGDGPENSNAAKPRPKAAPRLEYDPGLSAYAATRRFRMLMGLTLLNTLMIAALFVGPYLMPFVRQKWQQFQVAREMERERQRLAAIERQCLTHSAPPDKVVYEEDPAEAERLLAATGGGYESVMPGLGGGKRFHAPRRVLRGESDDLPAPPGYQPPVRAAVPQYVNDFVDVAGGFSVGGGGGGLFGGVSHQSDAALLFLHERKAPNGDRLLVEVWLEPGIEFGSNRTIVDGVTFQMFGMMKRRRLFARAWTIPAAPGTPQTVHAWTVLLVLPDVAVEDVAQARISGRLPEDAPDAGEDDDAEVSTTMPAVPIKYGSRLRVFAGQPDPKDEGRFTIDYELDGRRGTIDGRLRGDRVVLRPRDGRRASAETVQKIPNPGSDEVWDLTAPPAETK